MLRFGVGLPGVQQVPSRVQPWERDLGGPELLTAARAAEQAGFSWVSCSDHVVIPASRAAAMGATWYDAGSTLAFVAGGTRTIGLLSHVLVLPYRHPLVVAKQYGTLDHLSDGRLILGVGSGHLKPEFAILGADYARRGKVTDEYLAAIAAAWDAEPARFSGHAVSFRDVLVSPRPARRPPIWVGGNSRAAVRRAARHGDGWIPWQLTPDDFRAAAALATAERARAGRSDSFTLVAPVALAPETGAEGIVEAVATWRAAGATAFHVGVGARSFTDFLERVERFGRDIARRLG